MQKRRLIDEPAFPLKLRIALMSVRESCERLPPMGYPFGSFASNRYPSYGATKRAQPIINRSQYPENSL
jgi:hypothetical protein